MEYPTGWKVSTTYKRSQKGFADVVLWSDQSKIVAKNILLGDAELICKAVNEYLKREDEKMIDLRSLAQLTYAYLLSTHTNVKGRDKP